MTALAVLHLYAGGGLFISASVYGDGSRIFVQCYGDGVWTAVILDDDGVTVSDSTRGAILAQWKNSMRRDEGLLSRLRGLFVPSHITVKGFDDPDTVPTEDVRLRNRHGWVFASLGLAASGSPGVAFADSSGAVRLTWFQHKGIAETLAEWIAANRKSGRYRRRNSR